jgi:hypothetical protein
MPEGQVEAFESQFGIPRCRNCGYVLENLPSDRCPECGTVFDFDDPESYTLKPPFIRWRFWLPGLMLALGGGMAAYLVVVGLAGFGTASTLVLPACVGAIIGYSCRVRIFLIVLISLIGMAGICTGLFTVQLVGLLCGLMLAGIAIGPLIIGTLLGVALRAALKRSRFDQRWHLPLIGFLLAPLLWGLIERYARKPDAAETVQTSVVIEAPPARAWDALMFYEEVRHGPPPLFRIGMPRPLYTAGSAAAVGDRKVCVYDRGRLVKRITARQPQRLLAFRVVEQGFERHAMTLAGGSFAFEPVEGDPRQTRVTLSTTYHPHLGPRWCWRPFERLTVHTLHRHVLRGMAEKAGQRELASAQVDRAEARR